MRKVEMEEAMEPQQKAEIRIQGIRVVSCPFDGSGYAQGVRNWVRGMRDANVPLWIHPVSFEKDRPDLGADFELFDSLCRQPLQHDINFVRLSPEVGVQFLEPNSVNILSCAWETSRLDPMWVDCCNKFDAVFVESRWSVDVFKDSGVKVPIHLVPNYVDASLFKPKESVGQGTYKFYSIQQWTERKNGAGLLKAYYNAFTEQDDVLLVLKTYLTRVEEQQNQRDIIKEHIANLKRSLNLVKGYAPVYLITEKLTNEALRKLHEECDCYVLLDRGEGLGLPYMDAAAAANPIVATDFGGSRQFLNETNSYPVKYQLTFVDNMGWNQFYRGEQMWAEPNLPHAAELMRHVYDNRAEAFEVGKQARLNMVDLYNKERITQVLLSNIADVVARKRGMK
jgi:glycosyltransferase involved in cell wall biosynthesis